MKRIIVVFVIIISLLLSAVSCSDKAQPANTSEKNTLSASSLSEKEHECTFLIECTSVFDNREDLDPAVSSYIPADGLILRESAVTFEQGESVADVLRRICDENGIAIETSGTLGSGSLYVEGIGHLYEFDCGEGSGWMYRVNGVYPNFGADSYIISDGDTVEWKYTCDFGADIGGMEEH